MKKAIILIYLLILTNNIFASDFKIKVTEQTYIDSKNILLKYLNKIEFNIPTKKEVTFHLFTKKQIKDIKPTFYTKLNQFKNDSYLIKILDDDIYIIGSNHRSLNYAIYYFLENTLNCKFLSKSFEIIPSKIDVDIKKIDVIKEARFNYREIFIHELEDNTFATKLGLNGSFGHKAKNSNSTFINTYNNFTSYELIPLRYKDLYPEFFCEGQLDFASKDVKKYASSNFLKKVKQIKKKSDNLFYIGHEDIPSYCNSKISKKLIDKYSSTTAPFLDYANYLAKDLGKVNKDAKVFMEAYQWSRRAPDNFPKLSPNLNIFFSDIEADFSKEINSDKNKEIYKDLLSWKKYKRDIYIWHYITNFNGYLQPFPNIKSTANDIKTFSKTNQIKGIFLQGAYETSHANLSNLRAWVFSKLLWDPFLKVDNLINEFVYYYYGKSHKEVSKYLNLLEASVKNTNSSLEVKTSINSDYLNKDFIREAKHILDEALKKVPKNSIYYKHIIELYSGIDYVQLLRGTINKEDKKRFKRFLKNSKMTYYAESNSIKSLEPYFNINRRKASIPKLIQNPNTKWLDFQEYQLKLCCSTIVEDKLASSRSAVRMDGNKSDWGVQLDLKNIPKGKWKIYANIRIEKAKKLNKLKYIKPAIYYGIYKKDIKNLSLINTLKDEKYHEVNIANLNIKKDDSGTIWIRPPESKDIKYIYVDRIFIIKDI